MATHPRKKPPTLDITQVTIRVYPFIGVMPIPGWIAQGKLATVAGIPALSSVVEIDRPPNDDARFADYLTAGECIRMCGYRRAVAVMLNGSKLKL